MNFRSALKLMLTACLAFGVLEIDAQMSPSVPKRSAKTEAASRKGTARSHTAPGPLKTTPQLDSGDKFVAYLRKLNREDRVSYLRQQIVKYPQSPFRTKALEEVLWLSPNPATEPEFKTLQTEDPTNLTVQVISLPAELDRMQGHPEAQPADGDVTTVNDVITRWKAATGFDHLAQHSYLLTHEVMAEAGEEKAHEIDCATDLKNVRQEEPEDYEITAAKTGLFQYYRPRQNPQSISTSQAAGKYDNSTTYFSVCLNLPGSVQSPDQYKFAGIKTFFGASAYALADNSGNSEDYFDAKSFFYLGSQETKGAWTKNAFGYRDFGGAVLPQYVLFHFNNNIRLRKFTGLQWDHAPALEGAIYTLELTPYPEYPQTKWVKPILGGAITQNEIELQPKRIQQQVDKLTMAANAQFGLDPSAQKNRVAALSSIQTQAAALSQNSQNWDQVASGVFAAVAQHDRQRRFKEPVNARDVYLNWQDVTNLKPLLAHKSLRVQMKHSMSGSNSDTSYCAMSDGDKLRHESVGTLILQNNQGEDIFNFDKKRGVSGPTVQPSNPASLRQTFLSSCLIGLNDVESAEYALPTSPLGTGTIYKRPAYVIFEKYNSSDSIDTATRLFFDKETYLLLATQSGKDESPVSYSDFRKVGGAIIPFRKYRYEGGQYPYDDIDTIEKLDFDVPLDAKEFDLTPANPTILYASTLREKRPDLYKTPSPWAALATGALLGVAQGSANNPNLFNNAQQAQLASLEATILAKEVGGDLTKLAGPSFAGLSSNQSAMQMTGTLSPGGIFASSVPLMTPAQLQMLEGLILNSSASGKGGDSFSDSLLKTLKQMAGEGNSIQHTANDQTAAIQGIGDTNATAHQQSQKGQQAGDATQGSLSSGNSSDSANGSCPSIPEAWVKFTFTWTNNAMGGGKNVETKIVNNGPEAFTYVYKEHYRNGEGDKFWQEGGYLDPGASHSLGVCYDNDLCKTGTPTVEIVGWRNRDFDDTGANGRACQRALKSLLGK